MSYISIGTPAGGVSFSTDTAFGAGKSLDLTSGNGYVYVDTAPQTGGQAVRVGMIGSARKIAVALAALTR